jgi:copper resistance protein C
MKRAATALIAAALLAIGAPAAFAHTHVRSTSIAENAQLAQAPASFTVTFSEAAGLANVTLTNAAGAAVAINYQPPQTMAASYTIPLPNLAPGAYALSWRTIAKDGHVMNGGVHFSIGTAQRTAMPMGQTTAAGMGAMLTSSSPSEGATLAQTPRAIGLSFVQPVLLQTLTVRGADGRPVRVAFTRPHAATASYSVPLPSLTRGAYTAHWIATGMGHNMQGNLHFTVQ